MSLFAEYLHFVLVKALVAAELKLVVAVLEVDVVDGVSDVSAPVADAVLLEGRSPALVETRLAAERFGLARRRFQGEQLQAQFQAPAANDAVAPTL